MSDEERLREALRGVVEWMEDMRPTMWDGAEDVDRMLPSLRAALHPAESFYACPTCGENVTRYGQRCPTCERAIEHDRLERESGR